MIVVAVNWELSRHLPRNMRRAVRYGSRAFRLAVDGCDIPWWRVVANCRNNVAFGIWSRRARLARDFKLQPGKLRGMSYSDLIKFEVEARNGNDEARI
jgi:hypothetical protein